MLSNSAGKVASSVCATQNACINPAAKSWQEQVAPGSSAVVTVMHVHHYHHFSNSLNHDITINYVNGPFCSNTVNNNQRNHISSDSSVHHPENDLIVNKVVENATQSATNSILQDSISHSAAVCVSNTSTKHTLDSPEIPNAKRRRTVENTCVPPPQSCIVNISDTLPQTNKDYNRKTRRRYDIDFRLRAIARCEAANEDFVQIPGGTGPYYAIVNDLWGHCTGAKRKHYNKQLQEWVDNKAKILCESTKKNDGKHKCCRSAEHAEKQRKLPKIAEQLIYFHILHALDVDKRSVHAMTFIFGHIKQYARLIVLRFKVHALGIQTF